MLQSCREGIPVADGFAHRRTLALDRQHYQAVVGNSSQRHRPAPKLAHQEG